METRAFPHITQLEQVFPSRLLFDGKPDAITSGSHIPLRILTTDSGPGDQAIEPEMGVDGRFTLQKLQVPAIG